MRYLLQLCVLFVLLAPSAVFGADQIRLAQSFQTAPPVPPPQLLPQATIAGTCNITCDSAAMSCLNTCVALSPNTPANPQCSLTCTCQGWPIDETPRPRGGRQQRHDGHPLLLKRFNARKYEQLQCPCQGLERGDHPSVRTADSASPAG